MPTQAASGVRLNNEKKLIDKLQKTYPQKYGRPLMNLTGPVVIQLRSQLIQIVKVVSFIVINKFKITI